MNPLIRTLSRAVLACALCAGFSAPVSATLLLRDANGYATLNAARASYAYDTVLNLTWVLEPSTESFTWQQAQQWAASLQLLGLTGWKLPTADLSCLPGAYACAGTPLSELFFGELGNQAPGVGSPEPIRTGPFQSLTGLDVWTSGEYRPGATTGLYFSLAHGFQSIHSKTVGLHALVEHEGDVLRVSAVPEPQMLALVALGVGGLVVRRRGQRHRA